MNRFYVGAAVSLLFVVGCIAWSAASLLLTDPGPWHVAANLGSTTVLVGGGLLATADCLLRARRGPWE